LQPNGSYNVFSYAILEQAKGRLHRWDFETEEEWAKYNDQKAAMPKAAFPFGVKMQDGEDQEAEQGPEAHE
jgi:hypothetical protein